MDLIAAMHRCSGCGNAVPLVWNYSRRASVLDLGSPATVCRTSPNTITHSVVDAIRFSWGIWPIL